MKNKKIDMICAEFITWAKSYHGAKFHAVLSDPPYGLHFMGKNWDRITAKDWGKALLPLLHPGALIFMFSGTRTWHRLAIGMEEAGFEIWDTLMWLHGQGFPKAQAIDKLMKQKGNEWSGHKTAALKPAWEPILCFRAPRQGKNYVELALEHGSGALNVDGGRIGVEEISTHGYPGEDLMGAAKGRPVKGKLDYHTATGRYPANLVLDEESAEMLDRQAGDRAGCQPHRITSHVDSYEGWGSITRRKGEMVGYEGKGGPARFFYCAKASRSERGKENRHPTVKPVSLTKWLATLLLPPDSVRSRRLLVPFAGSGSELIGAARAGWDRIVGIEIEKTSYKIALRRIRESGRS